MSPGYELLEQREINRLGRLMAVGSQRGDEWEAAATAVNAMFWNSNIVWSGSGLWTHLHTIIRMGHSDLPNDEVFGEVAAGEAEEDDAVEASEDDAQRHPRVFVSEEE